MNEESCTDMPASQQAVTILVVEDHPIFIQGLMLLLNGLFPEGNVISVNSCRQALMQLELGNSFDCILLDYELPDGNGLGLLAELNEAMVSAPVIFISAIENVAQIERFLARGASGFIPKSADASVYLRGIQTVLDGGEYVPSELIAPLKQYRQHRDKQLSQYKLTPQQSDMLVLIAEGYSNREIADALHISPSTVKRHISTLIDTFGVNNRAECVAESRRLNLFG